MPRLFHEFEQGEGTADLVRGAGQRRPGRVDPGPGQQRDEGG